MVRKINRTQKYADIGYWNSTTVKAILTNDLYTGDMVQNRRSRISYKIRQIVPNDKSKWIRVENTHEAIVSKEDFEEVGRLLGVNNGLRYEKKIRGVFDGLIYCYECKHRMALVLYVKRGNKIILKNPISLIVAQGGYWVLVLVIQDKNIFIYQNHKLILFSQLLVRNLVF